MDCQDEIVECEHHVIDDVCEQCMPDLYRDKYGDEIMSGRVVSKLENGVELSNNVASESQVDSVKVSHEHIAQFQHSSKVVDSQYIADEKTL